MMRALLLSLTLALVLPILLAGCGPGDDDNPFGSGVGDDDDDDDATDEPGPDDRAGWIEFSRNSLLANSEFRTYAFASWFSPTPVTFGTPIPDGVDTCESGLDHPDLFYLPTSQSDVGTVTLSLLGEAGDIDIDEFDVLEGRWQVDIDTDDWVPEQEYDVQATGGADVGALDLPGIVGTPEVLALTDLLSNVAEGILIRWYGANSNSHVEVRFETDPIEGDPKDEDTGKIRWVACRLFDDGQHTVAWSEFDDLEGLDTFFRLTRRRSVDFDMGDGMTGVAVGSSHVHTTYTFPGEAGDDDDDDDDDSAADDDDSAR